MPEIDGFAVLEFIRSERRTHRAPVIVLSGKILSLPDIQRLDRAQVFFQSKNILTEPEQVTLVRQALSGDTLPGPTSEVVKRAIAFIHAHYDRPIRRTDLAVAGGICESYLSTVFHKEMGLAPWEYLTRFRIQIAREALAATDDSVTQIAGYVGFDDPSYFCRVFRRYVGQSPQSYRRAARAAIAGALPLA
jgi:AraC-like DNA-binding protein